MLPQTPRQGWGTLIAEGLTIVTALRSRYEYAIRGTKTNMNDPL